MNHITSPKSPSSGDHRAKYKNTGLTPTELRRRREEEGIQLRKQRRDDNLFKRRNVEFDQSDSVSTSGLESSAGVRVDSQAGAAITQEMVQRLFADDIGTQLDGLRQIRVLSQNPDKNIEDILHAGVVDRFVQFLYGTPHNASANSVNLGDTPECALQYESAWILTNISSGTTFQTKAVVSAGAVPLLIALLGSANQRVREQAVWNLANIAGDSPTFRDLVLQANGMPALLNLIRSALARFVQFHQPGATGDQSSVKSVKNEITHAVWCLANFCRGQNPPAPPDVTIEALPMINQILMAHTSGAQSTMPMDDQILAEACSALSSISASQSLQSIIDGGLCRLAVQLMNHRSRPVVMAAMRTVGNIVTGNHIQTQAALDCHAIPILASLFARWDDVRILKEACWIFSNITAGNHSQIQAVLDHGVGVTLVEIMTRGDYNSRKEATWAIANVTFGGTSDQIRTIVSQGCIPPICQMLTVTDAKIVDLCLLAINKILSVGQTAEDTNIYADLVDECDGLTRIEHWTTATACPQITQKASNIIDKYFSSASRPMFASDGVGGVSDLDYVPPIVTNGNGGSTAAVLSNYMPPPSDAQGTYNF